MRVLCKATKDSGYIKGAVVLGDLGIHATIGIDLVECVLDPVVTILGIVHRDVIAVGWG